MQIRENQIRVFFETVVHTIAVVSVDVDIRDPG